MKNEHSTKQDSYRMLMDLNSCNLIMNSLNVKCPIKNHYVATFAVNILHMHFACMCVYLSPHGMCGTNKKILGK